MLAVLMFTASAENGPMSAQSLSIHPTCVLYEGNSGETRAYIQGAVERDGLPLPNVKQELVDSHGSHFWTVSDGDGFYIKDVEVKAPVSFREGRALLHGDDIYSIRARMNCLSPQVIVAPLQVVHL